MAFEFEVLRDEPIPLLYDDVLDTLRHMQTKVDFNANIGRVEQEDKQFYYRRAAEELPLDEWVGRYRRFEADRFVAKSPDLSDRQRLVCNTGIVVIGRLDLPAYLFDEDLPIDDVTVPVLDPSIVDIDSGSEQLEANLPDGAVYRADCFFLPVLAVSSCVTLASSCVARTQWKGQKAQEIN